MEMKQLKGNKLEFDRLCSRLADILIMVGELRELIFETCAENKEIKEYMGLITNEEKEF